MDDARCVLVYEQYCDLFGWMFCGCGSPETTQGERLISSIWRSNGATALVDVSNCSELTCGLGENLICGEWHGLPDGLICCAEGSGRDGVRIPFRTVWGICFVPYPKDP